MLDTSSDQQSYALFGGVPTRMNDQIRTPPVVTTNYFLFFFCSSLLNSQSCVISSFLFLKYFVQVMSPCPYPSFIYNTVQIVARRVVRMLLNSLDCGSSKTFNHSLNHNSKIHTDHQFCDFQHLLSFRQSSTVTCTPSFSFHFIFFFHFIIYLP